MSYAFQVRAASKVLAKQLLIEKFDHDVVAHQPVHANDRSQVLANVDAVVDFLPNDETKDVAISVNGSLGWSGAYEGEERQFTSISVSASAYLVSRES